ncbi:MAG: MFS transporter [Bacteroidaceae bacterium]|nr:MFS transporter [Bacteroidaceae bacterium]MBR5612401.1 MFS transporter [Bacteroidaceae bacterium]
MNIGIPRQYLAVVAVLAAIMMGVLDGTVMNVALPTLSKEFDVSASNIIWVVNAYQLVVTMMLLGFAAIGDVFGYKRVFLCGVSIFVTASALCAMSRSFEMMVFARVLQGMGGACTMSINIALLRLIFPPHRLGRVMAANAVIVAVTAASGPTLGGAILSIGHWSWIFLLNIPLGLLALVLGWKLLPHNPPTKEPKRLDGQSIVMNAVFFGLLIYTVEGIAHDGISTLLVLQGVITVIVGVMYIRRQLQIPMPILPVDLFRIPIFSMSIGCSIACFTAQMMALVSLPFFMQHTLSMSVAETGLMLTPWPLATTLTAPLAGRLIEKVHPGILGAIGMMVFTLGLLLLSVVGKGVGLADLAWRMAVCGVGIGLFQTPNNVTITTSAPIRRSGGASGMLGTARVLGQTLGTAIVAIVFHLVSSPNSEKTCFYVAITFAATAAIVSFLRIKETSPLSKE